MTIGNLQCGCELILSITIGVMLATFFTRFLDKILVRFLDKILK